MPLFLTVAEIHKVCKWSKIRFFRLFGPACRNPLANLDDSMPECAQVCVPKYATTLDDAQENRNGRRLIIPETGITSLTFWTTLQNPVGDGSIHMRQLDRGWIKHFSVCCIYASIYNGCRDIQGRKFSKQLNIRIFSNFLAHFVETPWPTQMAQCQNVRRSVPYMLNYIWKRWEKQKWQLFTARMRPSPIFSVFNSPYTRPQGRMDPRGRRGTSADIVHALLRYRSKTTKIQKLSIDSYSNKNFISPFFRPRRPLTPKGEKTSETRVRPHAKFGENRRTGCREIADQTKKEKQQVRQN